MADTTSTGDVNPLMNGCDFDLTGSVFVGRSGKGDVVISGGCQVNLLTTVAGVFLGGFQGPLPPSRSGIGTLTIDGPGSALITTTQRGGFVAVGRWGTSSQGTLSITNAGALTTLGLFAGIGEAGGTGSTGSIVVDASSVSLSGIRPAPRPGSPRDESSRD